MSETVDTPDRGHVGATPAESTVSGMTQEADRRGRTCIDWERAAHRFDGTLR
ncbi:MAG: hypothetical protein KDJ39_18545 [Gammaproteobacteria bacterium]|nr:hypothetical protein [Gammaproteobacteria bacterium]MCP5299470.1 hypothetical protein [Chromatiaceae bacterium]